MAPAPSRLVGSYSWDILTYFCFRNFDVFGHLDEWSFWTFPELFYPSGMTIMCIYNPG